MNKDELLAMIDDLENRLFVSVYRNVQLSKNLQEARDYERFLKDSEERYLEYLNELPLPIYVLNNNEIFFCNRKFLVLCGYDGMQGVSQKDLKELLLSRDELERGLVSDYKNPFTEFMVHLRLLDGSVFKGEALEKRIISDGMTFYLGIIRDSESKVSSKAAEASIIQAEKMEALSLLAGGISHDFNNILNSILGCCEIIYSKYSDDQFIKGKIEQINSASYRAKKLVKQILNYSKGESVVKTDFYIKDLVEETVRLLRFFIDKSIDIRFTCQENLNCILGDETQIQQVIMNLCTNAAHSMEHKGGRIYIELFREDFKQKKTGDSILEGPFQCLVVRDTGYGIAKEKLDRIFDPYFTTKNANKGSGLGLTIVKGIMKNHNGSIEVTSDPAKGTEFRVYLPENFNVRPVIDLDSREVLKYGEGQLILYIDDDKDVLQLGQEMMEAINYRTACFNNPLDAFNYFLANRGKISAVVTDYSLPVFTGLKLAERIRDIDNNIPVILFTGYDEFLRSESEQKGIINACILKPLDMKTLANKLHKLIFK